MDVFAKGTLSRQIRDGFHAGFACMKTIYFFSKICQPRRLLLMDLTFDYGFWRSNRIASKVTFRALNFEGQVV